MCAFSAGQKSGLAARADGTRCQSFLFNRAYSCRSINTLFMSNVIAKSKALITLEARIEKSRANYSGKIWERSNEGKALIKEKAELERLAAARPVKEVANVSKAKAQAEYDRLLQRYGVDSARKFAESVTSDKYDFVSQSTLHLRGSKVVQQVHRLTTTDDARAASLGEAFASYKRRVDGKTMMIPGKIFSSEHNGIFFRISWARKGRPATKPEATLTIGRGKSAQRIPVKNLAHCKDLLNEFSK